MKVIWILWKICTGKDIKGPCLGPVSQEVLSLSSAQVLLMFFLHTDSKEFLTVKNALVAREMMACVKFREREREGERERESGRRMRCGAGFKTSKDKFRDMRCIRREVSTTSNDWEKIVLYSTNHHKPSQTINLEVTRQDCTRFNNTQTSKPIARSTMQICWFV